MQGGVRGTLERLSWSFYSSLLAMEYGVTSIGGAVTNKARLGEESGGEGDEVGAVHTAAGARRAGGGAAVPMALSGRGEERGWGGVGRRGGGERER
jgi:hypothetical protein